PLDEPGPLGTVDAELRRRGDALVDQAVAGGQPDLPAPGARADQLAEPEAAEALGERLAVGRRPFVAQDDHVAAEGVLHVPVRRADPRLPVEPGAPHQLLEDPRVDVAAAVVTHVDDEPGAIEDRIEVALPFGHVAAAHGAQVEVADLRLPRLLDALAAGVL